MFKTVLSDAAKRALEAWNKAPIVGGRQFGDGFWEVELDDQVWARLQKVPGQSTSDKILNAVAGIRWSN